MSQTLGLNVLPYIKVPDLTPCLAVTSADLNLALIIET